MIIDIDRKRARRTASFDAKIREFNAFGQLAIFTKPIEETNRRAGCPPNIILSSLHRIKFFKHGIRDHHMVFLKHKQCVGIMQQHIGIKHIVLGFVVVCCGVGCRCLLGRSGHIGGSLLDVHQYPLSAIWAFKPIQIDYSFASDSLPVSFIYMCIAIWP